MNKFTLCTLQFVLVASGLNAQNFQEKINTNQHLSFKENKGQVSDQFFRSRTDVLFSGNSGELFFYLKSNGISYQLNRIDSWKSEEDHHKKSFIVKEETLMPDQTTSYRLDITWLNSNNNPQIKKGEALPGYENYYLPSCPDGALGVKKFEDLIYRNIYPGIDLKWYSKEENLKYEYYVSENTDYKQIQLEIKGAESVNVNTAGELVIKTPLGIIKEQKPLVKQNNRVLPAKWSVKNNIISFDIKTYDPSLPLLIDPLVRLWGSYFGGSGVDDTHAIHADASGHVYISGCSRSTANIATNGAHQIVFGGGGSGKNDAYVAKFHSSGIMQWATYYGGTGNDYGSESAVDILGNVFLVGSTSSPDPGVMTTNGAHQVAYSTVSTNSDDAFLVKFNAHGIRVWGTYYGGDKAEVGQGVSLDANGDIFITGGSFSTNNISTPGAHQFSLTGNSNPFLAKFNTSGVRQWGTYYGGSGIYNQAAFGCITDASGFTYITGTTSSSLSISTPGSHQSTWGGSINPSDAFLAKFDPSGAIQWATYYGGAAMDFGYDLALDASNNVYMCGVTNSSLTNVIATVGSHQQVYGGGNEGFLVKFSPSGTRLWGTYYGGSGSEFCFGTSVDGSGNVYVAGSASASSATAITTSCTYQEVFSGGSSDGFLAKFTNSGQRIFGTYYGSMFMDELNNCSADAAGNVYVSGVTLANSGTLISTSNGYQPAGSGQSDGFIVKFDGCIPGALPHLSSPASLIVCAGNSASLSAGCGNWYASPGGTLILSTGSTFTPGPITSDTTFYLEDFSCGSVFGTRTAISLTVAPVPSLTLTNSNPVACVSESVTLSASGASTYSWSGPFISSVNSAIQVYVLLQTTYSVAASGTNGCESTAHITIVPNLCIGINEQTILTPHVIVYPNPNNGILNIRSISELDLFLSNELGQTLQSIHLSASNNFIVSLDNLPNGVYFLSGEKNSNIKNKKIVVMH